VLPGSFEVSRLRELFEPRREEPSSAPAEFDGESEEESEAPGDSAEPPLAQMLAQLLAKHEATTVGGLVSELAGHIPLPGEVVEDGPLRLEVIASTDRLVERVRVGLMGSPVASEAE
jgi:CBS domain containing-hemolysin-like protein